MLDSPSCHLLGVLPLLLLLLLLLLPHAVMRASVCQSPSQSHCTSLYCLCRQWLLEGCQQPGAVRAAFHHHHHLHSDPHHESEVLVRGSGSGSSSGGGDDRKQEEAVEAGRGVTPSAPPKPNGEAGRERHKAAPVGWQDAPRGGMSDHLAPEDASVEAEQDVRKRGRRGERCQMASIAEGAATAGAVIGEVRDRNRGLDREAESATGDGRWSGGLRKAEEGKRMAVEVGEALQARRGDEGSREQQGDGMGGTPFGEGEQGARGATVAAAAAAAGAVRGTEEVQRGGGGADEAEGEQGPTPATAVAAVVEREGAESEEAERGSQQAATGSKVSREEVGRNRPEAAQGEEIHAERRRQEEGGAEGMAVHAAGEVAMADYQGKEEEEEGARGAGMDGTQGEGAGGERNGAGEAIRKMNGVLAGHAVGTAQPGARGAGGDGGGVEGQAGGDAAGGPVAVSATEGGEEVATAQQHGLLGDAGVSGPRASKNEMVGGEGREEGHVVRCEPTPVTFPAFLLHCQRARKR